MAGEVWWWTTRALDRLLRRRVIRARGTAVASMSVVGTPAVTQVSPTLEQRLKNLEYWMDRLRSKRDPFPGVVLIVLGIVLLLVANLLAVSS